MDISITEVILILGLLGLFATPLIFFLLTLQKTFKEISVENRQMEPNEVWLTLIPLFGIVWQFIIVNKLALSLKAEFKKRNIRTPDEKPGHSIGITYCTLSCCSIIPILGVLASVASIVCWIAYWVKINEYKSELIKHPLSSTPN